MGIIAHNSRYRKIWMFPRNIRRIHPWKMAQICSLINELVSAGSWTGNQSMQNAFCKALENAGLKRRGVQYSPNSGGPRTYFGQLKCLGLIFQREDKSVWFTKAGEDLLKGEPPLPIMQRLLLRHQYPSVYQKLNNVKINPDIKVKPFLFVLDLMLDRRIGHLTIEELCIPVVYGHNQDCLELCVEKILRLRAGEKLKDVVTDAADYYTPRAKRRSKADALKDIHDIANTCKNYLQAVCLIDVIDNGRAEEIKINPDMLPVIHEAQREKSRFISVNDDEESFQRAYGSWDSAKDTRLLTKEGVEQKISSGESIIAAMFMQYCGERPVVSFPQDFIERMIREFGFREKFITEVITPFLARSLSYFESTFLELSKGGQVKALEFERAVGNLFKDRLLFKVTHTGQLKRPSGVGGYSDLFLIALDDKTCALVEVKASPFYTLSSEDYEKMASNYIPNSNELIGGRDLKLEFCVYVAGGFHAPSVAHKLVEIKRKTNLDASAISALDLLSLAKRGIDADGQVKLTRVFKKNKILSVSDLN